MVLATTRKRSNGLQDTFEWHRDRKDDVQHAGLGEFFFNISMLPTEMISLSNETQELVLI